MRKQDKERIDYIAIPRKLQDIIPVKMIYPDGIFKLNNGRYSKSYIVKDINYASAGKEERKSMANKYAELLSGMDSDAMYEITVSKRKFDKNTYDENVFLKYREDGLDEYRSEYNDMINEIFTASNMMYREIYITISLYKKSYEDVKSVFDKFENSMSICLGEAGSGIRSLSAEQRLRILYDFYRGDGTCNIDLLDMIKTGRDVRTYICPDNFVCEDDKIKMGTRYCRALLLRDIPSYLKDDIVQRLTEIKNPVMLSITTDPISTEVAVREVEERLMKVNTNIDSWKTKQKNRKLPFDEIPYAFDLQRKEVKSILDELTYNDNRMMYTTLTIVHTADTEEELDADTERILTSANEARCQITVLHYRQLDGILTALPFGLRCIDFSRTMLTGSMLAFTPFFVQETKDINGTFYGENRISHNLIMADKEKLKNANMMILGKPGSGKSVMAKNELFYNVLKDPDMDVIVIDPERENGNIVKTLGGDVAIVSAGSDVHINLMEFNKDYSIEDKKPIAMKSQFLLSVCEQIMGEISAVDKSIIDRCVRTIYKDYVDNDYQGKIPTFKALYDEIKGCEEPEARDIALALELFVTGSLNIFANESNVNQDSRVLCYDLYDMDEQLRPVGMLVILDNVLNRVTRNRFNGRKTTIIIDELYLYLKHEYTADFLYVLWKRIRKANGYCVGITQNVRDLRNSPTARTMLSNSEFVCLLSQAEDDIDDLRSLLKISEDQINYVMDSDEGCGLFKIGRTIIPFKNHIPDHTKLYKLMTTKPKEVQYGREE